MDVLHDKENNRFVYSVDNIEAQLKYHDLGNNTLEYYSTFVPNELRGQGIAGKLVKFAADYAKENGIKVVPTCSFVVKFYERNPE
ncbi:MAG: N-acetyltransferase [Melioribacteraceae bacterium]|nr:N-acetyltransferase [Melioribacteraceae bacterium]